MASLGSFGAAVRELDTSAPDTFTYFGETFTVYGVLPPILMLQLGAAASGRLTELDGFGAVWEAMRCALTKPGHVDAGEKAVPEDDVQWRRFYHLAAANRDHINTLIDLTYKVFEVQAGRPTREPQGSLPGQSTTSQSSNNSSSTHPALAHLRPVSEVLVG